MGDGSPTALKQGGGIEVKQKELIEQILNIHPNVNEFAEHIYDTYEHDVIVEKIYSYLK